MSFKILHQFTISIDREIEEISTRTEGGQEITTRTKVTKPIQCVIVLKEPSRREKQDVSLFQTITYNEAVKLGLMPRLVMTQNLAKDPSSLLSQSEDQNLAAMTVRLQELANDYIRLNAKSSPDSDEDRERKEALVKEYNALEKRSVDINSAYQSVFSHTAEYYVQHKVLTWLSLYLTYLKVGPDKYEPLFPGADFKAKEEKAGELDDSGDKLYMATATKLGPYWALFYFGHASNTEQFKKAEETWAKQAEEARLARVAAEELEKQLLSVPPEAAPVADTTPLVLAQG